MESLIINSPQNPALSGMEHRHHAYFDYHRPWFNNFDMDFGRNNFGAGYDLGVKTSKERLKIGVGVYYAGESLKNTKQHSIGISNSFIIKFKNGSELGVGISLLAVTFKSIAFGNMRFGNQFDATIGGFNGAITNNESFDTDHLKRYGPFNLGIWYRAKNFFIGASSVNITVPYESFYEEHDWGSKARTPLVSYLNAGYHIGIKEKYTVTPSLQYKTETIYSETSNSSESVWFHSVQPRVTFAFSKNRFIAGTYYENDAMYLLLGIDLFHHHWLINFDGGWYVKTETDTGLQGFKLKTRVHF